MTNLSNQLEEALLTLAWSLWAELGVSSVVRNHSRLCVDPESLLIFTAGLADADPRLRDESLDCSLELAPYLWTGRLKTLLSRGSAAVRDSFAEYAATFNKAATTHTRLPFAVASKAMTLRRSRKSRPTTNAHAPSQLMVRCRSIFGVGARADAIAVMLCSERSNWLASELATHVGLPKRALASVLEDFARGGIVVAIPVANRIRYDLARRDALALVVGEIPQSKPAWSIVLPFLLELRTLISHGSKQGGVVRLVNAQKLIVSFIVDHAAIGIHQRGPDYRSWEAILAWSVALATGIANADSPLFPTRSGDAARELD